MIEITPDILTQDIVGSYAWGGIKARVDPSSYDFLDYAKQDLIDGQTPRNFINSISNAKRSLHSRLEDLCVGFGVKKTRNWKSFPRLIDYVRSCGVVAPQVLNMLNSLRNEVEHEYIVPPPEKVDIFIGVVELFLVATDRCLDRQPFEAEVTKELETMDGVVGLVRLTFDWGKGVAEIRYRKNGGGIWDLQKISYESPSEEFFKCAKFIMKNDY